jgi:threonine aldolase
MIVDLRSDTVTKPTPEMYAAMASAELGDNVLENDPTVRQLELLAAEMTGMDDALFVPSGTMGNQVALATWTNPGDSVLFEDQAHMIWYEGGGPAVFAGVVTRGLHAVDGVLAPDLIKRSILTRSHHTPGTTLLCLENTHNRHGGAVTPPDVHAEYRRIADEAGIKIHLDGARVFNAAAALGQPVKTITQHVDSVNFCLSKALASPVGSVLCGPQDFIDEATYWRKRFGGGLRQAGILAACGLVSLRQMVDRLPEDHARASSLAAHCANLRGLTPEPCPTNILILQTEKPAAWWQDELEKKDVRTIPFDAHRLRAVFHKDIDDVGLEKAKTAFASLA